MLFRDLVDPEDAYRDETGAYWQPLTAQGTESSEALFSNFHKFTEHQKECQYHARENPYAKNLLGNLRAYVTGGYTDRAILAANTEETPEAKQDVKALQDFLDEFSRVNRWNRRKKSAYYRLHRDGETILWKRKESNGILRVSILPTSRMAPSAKKDSDMGVIGSPIEPEAYLIQDKVVPAVEIQHRKINVDEECPRGVSTLWCVRHNLRRSSRLLRNMSVLVTVQAAIAMIRKHTQGKAAAENYANNLASYLQNTRNLAGDDVLRRIKVLGPGAIIDAPRDVEYDFPSISLNPAAPVEILQAELRAIASAVSLPEFMVGSDARNANYSSTMVAESPAVRFFEEERVLTREYDEELLWEAIEYAILEGRLPASVMDTCDIQQEFTELVTRDPDKVAASHATYVDRRILSPQTVQLRVGADPEEERKNWEEFDAANPAMPALPTNISIQ
jgi:hypothetical protein